MNAIVRSIDLGYGNTKYVSRDIKDDFECKSFESIAIIADEIQEVGKYNVMRVPAGNATYTVGDDAYLMSSLGNARPKHNNYLDSPEYEALMKGALSAMRVSRIDMLVVGLPVRLFRIKEKQKQLRDFWKGTHKLEGNKSVSIRNVVVLMQPYGGYMALRHDETCQRKDHFTSRTLIVDPGWHTLDWLMAEGVNPLLDSTDSNEMGVSGMLKRIGDKISASHSKSLPFPIHPSLSQVDGWVRSGEITSGNLQVAIEPYMGPGNEYVYRAVNAMYSSIEEVDTISQVVVVGGAAHLYLPAVKNVFRNTDVIVPADPIYANVRGYQLVGMDLYRRAEALKAG